MVTLDRRSGAPTDAISIAFIVDRRYLADQALSGALAWLRAEGCRVELIVPDGNEQLFPVPREAPAWDAVVTRGRALAGFGLLAAAAARGVMPVNSPAAIELVRNKVAMQARLMDHGIPVPRTWFAAHAGVFERLSPEYFPLVVKPFDGDGARGLALLTGPADVRLLPRPRGRRGLYLAQEWLETDGWDLKLYGIGSRMWAVRKPSPVDLSRAGPARVSPVEGATIVSLDAELRDIGLTCGRACGLELWGVDVARTPGGPVVIEVNDFPTYSAIPEAGSAIARHTMTLARMHRAAREAGFGRLHVFSRPNA
jgi:ribosomal protein S6--L-glutamate ligase